MNEKRNAVTLLIVFILGLFVGGIAMSKRPFGSFDVFDADKEKITWKDEVIATNLDIPWALAELPDERIIFTERTGKVKIMEKDRSIKTIAEIPVAIVTESGLTGLALHPDFPNTPLIYLSYTYRDGGELMNKVARYVFTNDTLAEDKIIFDKLAGGQIHNGGGLAFGPDKKLYIEVGDAARPELAQDMNSLSGKILRVNDDGSNPDDNPFPDSPIFSVGHRNPQGLAWHTLTEQLFATEHGETAHDELNLIKPGQNYGWADVESAETSDPRYTNPILNSGDDTWAPSGISFYGSSIWGLRYTALMAGLRSQQLLRVDIINGKVRSTESIFKEKYGRLRAVLKLKDGSLLVSTSNRDGRIEAKAEDDRIIKVTPVREE